MAMRGTVPDCCEWILHASLTWLLKVTWILHTSLTWLLKVTQQETEDEEELWWIQRCRQAEAQQQGGQLFEEHPAHLQKPTSASHATTSV